MFDTRNPISPADLAKVPHCRDCRFARRNFFSLFGDWGMAYCMHPSATLTLALMQKQIEFAASGRSYRATDCQTFCKLNREHACGIQGKYFEARSEASARKAVAS